MQIEFYWWEDCPSHEQAYERLLEAMRQAGVQATVQRVEVKTEADAVAYRFPGSPTIRINGEDIDPVSAVQNPTRLTCRVYRLPDGRFSPLPALETLTDALQKAKEKE